MQPSNVCWSLTIWMVQLALMFLTIQAQSCTKPIGGPNMVLSDALITHETFVDGATVTFDCTIGYVRAGGSRTVTCTAGVWSKVKLICERRSCGSPGEVMNGHYDLSEGILFGDKVVATCNTGYMLVGSDVRTCMDGGWDGRVPLCEVVSCPRPVVENAVRIEGRPPYTYKSFVTYKCNAGYEMEGQASLTCEIEGWSAPFPTCKAQNCTKPIGGPNMVLSDAFIAHETFVDGANVTFDCAIEYVRAGGSRTVTCTAGVWSKVKLECERKSCGSPGEVINGDFDLSEGILFGDKVVATCNTGYLLVGSGVRTCMDGGWDGRVPVCEVVKCGKPPTIINGGPVVPPEETYNFGAVVQYGCEKDYTLVGTKSITCSENGEFQPAPPECKTVVSCPPPVVENAVRIEGRPPYTYKSFVTYKCNAGYEMEGQASLTCEIEGWSAPFPTCKVVKCGKPPTIVNGGPVVPPEETYNYGSVVQYGCEKDYTLVGTKSIICSENGEFQPAPPECKMVSCPPPVVENGVLIEGHPPYTYKSFVTYKCNAGYEMDGQASLTCEIEGWSAPFPTCKALLYVEEYLVPLIKPRSPATTLG